MSNQISKLFLSICLLLAGSLSAQEGIIRGKVSELATGEALMFTNVTVQNTDPLIGEQTDLDGNYEIRIAPGIYALEVTYVGYTDKVIQDVEVKEGEVTIVDFIMEEASQQLEEVTIVAKQIDRTENALLTLQRKAITVQDGISAQEISRYGSSNAAESMKRVVGASVLGGKYIFVRGLGDRYSSAQLNGQQLPSTDPYRNSTQLDLIPANLLDNIIASKTFTPDQPGNFTGGNVNIKTKSFPESFTLSASISSSFNTLSSFNDNFLSYEGGDTDWLGIDDGTRAIPSNLIDNEENKEILDLLELNNPIQIRNRLALNPDLQKPFDDASKAFNNQFTPTRETTSFNHGISFSLGNQISLGDNPFGFLVGLNYKRNFQYYENAALNFYELSGSVGSGLVNPAYELNETAGTDNPTFGGLLNLSYKFGGSNKLSFNLLYNHDAEKTARYVTGRDFNRVSVNEDIESTALYFIEREIVSYQLNGEHVLGPNQIKLEWGAGYVQSKQDEPNFRLFENTFRILDQEPFDTIYSIDEAEFRTPSHFYRNLEDIQVQGKFDVTIPFAQSLSKANKIKIGGAYSSKERDFGNNIFEYVLNLDAVGPYAGDREGYLVGENLGIVDNDFAGRPIVGHFPQNKRVAVRKNSYTGTENIAAAYAMAIFDLDKLRIIGGARLENTDITVTSRDTAQQIGDIQGLDVLPSLSLVYKLTDDMNLRASATQTLARPNMRELAPFQSFDRGTDFQVVGNPELQRTKISNYDLRWEYFVRPGEVLAVSGYYKSFTNPIIKAFDIQAPNPAIQFQNVGEATVYGVEFEVRKSLDFVTPALENLRFIGNFSLIHSEVAVTEEECLNIETFNPDKGCTRTLQGQSPYLLNLALNYLDRERALDIVLSYNVFGERLILNNKGADPDFFQQPQPQLDFSLRKSFADRYGIRLSVNNILDTPYKQTLEFEGQEYIIRQFDRGITYGVSLSYNIR